MPFRLRATVNTDLVAPDFWLGARGALCLIAALSICLGCHRGTGTPGGPLDEEKNPYFVAGRDMVTAHDYKRAMRAFEKALEDNPNSVLAHYELGLLNEQQENDYVSAIYHYRQALKLRPDAYPADNAKVRIAGCKQELVKNELVAPVAQSMVRELEKLKQENLALRKQLEALQPPTRRPSDASPRADRTPTSSRNATTTTPTYVTPGGSNRSTGARTHVVKAGENPFSIARTYRITVDALIAANPNLRPRQLKVGQRLNIPAS